MSHIFLITLPCLELAKKRIRYICRSTEAPDVFYSQDNSSSQFLQKNLNPLFLACDVLSDSSVSAKNQARVHGRYAQQGLACKVTLKGCKVDGMKNSNSLWFYSIQGLFKAIFEYEDKISQASILTHLRDSWLCHAAYEPLRDDVELSPAVKTNNFKEQTFSVNVDTGNYSLQVPSNVKPPDTSEMILSAGESVGSVAEEVVQISQIDNHTSTGRYVNSSSFSQSESGKEDTVDGCKVAGICEEIRQLIRTRSKKMPKCQQFLTDKLLVLLDLFTAEYVNSDESYEGFPLSLLQQYTCMVSDEKAAEKFANEFNIPINVNIALYIMCQWVGETFRSMQEHISVKVERFKRENIGCIDSLPRPSELIDVLFPSAMRVLLEYWMGYHKDDCQSEDFPENTDEPPKKKSCWTSSSPSTLVEKQSVQTPRSLEHGDPVPNNDNSAPFIQIILEFANNVLVSGVAHVVYSRLVQGNS